MPALRGEGVTDGRQSSAGRRRLACAILHSLMSVSAAADGHGADVEPEPSGDPPDAVSVEALTCRFGPVVALDAVSFRVPAGSIVGLLGANGAGKSSIIDAVCGLLAPTSGRPAVFGIDVARSARRARALIGVVAQETALYDELSPPSSWSASSASPAAARPRRWSTRTADRTRSCSPPTWPPPTIRSRCNRWMRRARPGLCTTAPSSPPSAVAWPVPAPALLGMGPVAATAKTVELMRLD